MNNRGVSGMRIVRAISTLALLSMTITCGWADDDQSSQTISGRVINMDSIKSMITVRYIEPISGEANEIDIIVPEEAKIMNGPEVESFLDIEQFDSVTVTYYNDGAGVLKAKEILELNPANG